MPYGNKDPEQKKKATSPSSVEDQNDSNRIINEITEAMADVDVLPDDDAAFVSSTTATDVV